MYPLEENQNSKAQDPTATAPEAFLSLIHEQMADTDAPEAFGQHANAEINSQQLDSLELLASVLSLQPATVGADGASPEQRVLATITQLEEQIPVPLDLASLKFKLRDSNDPLLVVLVQEIGRYNVLLEAIQNIMFKLSRALRGLELITPELEASMISILNNNVPAAWSFAYFSLKPLASWIKDLIERYEHFSDWVKQGSHFVYWISAFTYPTAFTTSLQQKYSRKKDMPSIDRLEFEFIPQKDRPI